MEFGTFFKHVCAHDDLHDNAILALSDLAEHLHGEHVPPHPVEADDLEGWSDWTDALCDSDALDAEHAERARPALRAVLCDEIDKTGYGFSDLRKIILGEKRFRQEPFASIAHKLNMLQLFCRDLHVYLDPSDYPYKAEKRGLDDSAQSRAWHIASYARLAINELEEIEAFAQEWIDEQAEADAAGPPADDESSSPTSSPVPAAAE